jgi:predicted amidohydrolase
VVHRHRHVVHLGGSIAQQEVSVVHPAGVLVTAGILRSHTEVYSTI